MIIEENFSYHAVSPLKLILNDLRHHGSNYFTTQTFAEVALKLDISI